SQNKMAEQEIANKEKQAAGSSKRSADVLGEDELEGPRAKVSCLELFEEDNAINLRSDLADQINNYIRRHVSDKILKEKILEDYPIPSNIDKPQKLDMFMKDTLTSYKAFAMARDSQLYNIQSGIHKIFG
uniref:Uncharacterized protein n=1 Tax=Clytia hemisphaerica TaxID=252671 RepID=A0A7M5XL53_9CNID